MSDMNTAPAPAGDKPAPEGVSGQQGGTLLTGLIPDVKAPDSGADPSLKDKPAETKPTRKAHMAQMPKELQDNERLNQFNNFGELGKSFLELEGRLGKSVVIPGEDATDEERAAYRKRIGVPEKTDEYKFTKTQLPDGLRYDEALEASFTQRALKAGLTAAQADELFQWQTEATVQSHKDRQADMAREAEASFQKLRDKFGTSTAEELALTNRFLQTAASTFGPELAKKIEKSGLGNDTEFIQLVNFFAHQTGEDHFVGAGSGPETSSGFSYPGLKD